MKIMRKRVGSLLLAVTMMITLLPVTVRADAITSTTPYVDEHGTEYTVTATPITDTTTTLDGTTTGGWYVAEGDVTIASGVIGNTVFLSGNVKLILADGCKLQTGSMVTSGATLTIYGQAGGTGELEANATNSTGAAIGGSNSPVTINGGTVTAMSTQGAGIGGGLNSSNCPVTINGGIVNATSHQGAGIGGGESGGNSPVIINGGTVTATSEYGAGIGSGSWGFNNHVTINGGIINATSTYGAGIGSGCGDSMSGTITISGGTVTATSTQGAGIGSGYGYLSSPTIKISGGTVIAKSTQGSGIGGGYDGVVEGVDHRATIEITGGTVTATGVSGADIGGGSGTTITITGGTVNAPSLSATPKGAVGAEVLRTHITLEGVSTVTEITSLTIDGTPSVPTDTFTDMNGKVYLWLPSSATVTAATAGKQDYEGLVTAGGVDGKLEDKTLPTVASITPSGVDASIDANIMITFSEAMNDTVAGAVSLDNGIGDLPIGTWDTDKKVYTVPYAGLDYSKVYTVTISGFQDAAGNAMTADTSHSFTTIAEPLTPSVSANSLTANKGGTASFNVSLGQGALAASDAAITVTNGSIASVSKNQITAPETVTVTGLAAGTTGITVIFNDPAGTIKNVAVTVLPELTGNTGSGGSSSSDSSSAPPEKKPDYPVTAELSVTAKAGKNGHATATISESVIADAIKRATAAAQSQGKAENGIGISVTVNLPKNTSSLDLVLTQSVLRQLVDAKVRQFEVNGQILTLDLDQEALRQLLSQSSGEVTVTIKPVTVTGVRNTYQITFTTVEDGKTVSITSLGSGRATLSIPCTPGKKEAAGYLYAVYVDAKGKSNRIPGSTYDANSGSMMCSTNHFSIYGVGYTEPSAKFIDIKAHWGKEAIDYVVGRGLFSGTSKTTFAPDAAMTRGLLVTALGKLAGVDVKAYTTNSFTDVKTESTSRPYIEWAYKEGIMQGIGNRQFAPDRAITREEIALIFTNYATFTGYKLPVTREATAYADASSIGSVYKAAVTAMQQAGIMMGGKDNKFNSQASVTRAEVAAMLHRYIKLTIDPTTTQGWTLNDAGQWFYFKDGKAFTGTQIIGGVKYFFETTGVLKTGWVEDGDHRRYYSGNKAAVDWLDISDKRYYFTKEGLMVFDKWLKIKGKWYYFYADGSMAKNAKVDGYEVDKNGVRKTNAIP